MSGDLIWNMMVTGWLLKTGYEVLATPLTYVVVGKLKRVEQVDTFDRHIDFRPIPIGSSRGVA